MPRPAPGGSGQGGEVRALGLKNAEILYLYDAKDTNPNGDPDEENRPRMDYVGRRLLVSDVRLKRYVRDFLLAQGQDVWVRTREDGSHTDADGRLEDLLQSYSRETGKTADKKRLDRDFWDWFFRKLPDVRLFGAVLPIKAGEGEARGGTAQVVGPVQFDWGYALHPVEVYTASITSHFAGRDGEKGEYGTIGKDHRVHYALIGFWGRVSRLRGQRVGLTPNDLGLLERGLLEGLLEGATTRSKVGQTPRLYLRVDWQDGFKPLGDPRDGLRVVPKEGLSPEGLRSLRDYTLDAQSLAQNLRRYREAIARIRVWRHPDLEVQGLDLEGLPLEEVPF